MAQAPPSDASARPPVPIQQPNAAWPGQPGTQDVLVPVLILVGEDGRVESVEIVTSRGAALDAAAIHAAQHWVFEPARDATGPRRARVRAIVRFAGVVAPPPAPPVVPEPLVTSPGSPAAGGPPPEGRPSEVVVRGAAPPRSASEIEIERDVLEAAPRRTGSDLLRTVPGVFITQHSGEGKAHQIFFRGFDAVHGQDLELSVAGVPVNDVSNVHGQGYADLHFVIPEVVETIDALPGAFAPSQGDFAIAGSVRYHLGYDEPGVTLRGTYGQFDTRRLFVAYHPEGQPEATFAAAEVYETDGFGVGRAANRASAMGQWLFPIDEGLSGRVMASVYAGRFGSAGVLPLADIQAGRVDRFDSYDPGQGGHSTRAQVVTELAYDGGNWSASFAPFIVRRTLRLRHNFTGFIEDPVAGDATSQRNDATTLGANARFRRTVELFSDQDSFGAGLFARHDSIEQGHEPVRGDRPPLVDADITAADIGGYVDLAMRPISRVVVRGGVRADGLSYSVDDHLAGANRSSQGAFVGPRGVVDVAIAPGLRALASYGQGFRSPQARSLADGERTPLTRSHAFEAGLRFAQASELVASLAGFATLLDDDLVFNEATSRNEMAPGTLRLGAAAALTVRRGDWFTSAFGVSYTRATFRTSNDRFEEGDLVPFVPQVVARSDLSLRPALAKIAGHDLRGQLGAGLGGLFRRPLPFSEIGTDVFLLDAQAGLRYRFVELEVEAHNLLDRAWFDGEFVYTSSFDDRPTSIPRRHVTAGAPRTVLATLSVYF